MTVWRVLVAARHPGGRAGVSPGQVGAQVMVVLLANRRGGRGRRGPGQRRSARLEPPARPALRHVTGRARSTTRRRTVSCSPARTIDGMSGRGGTGAGSGVHSVGVLAVVLGTTLCGHVLVASALPSPAVLALTAGVVALLILPRLATGRSVVATVVLGQVAAHTVLAVVGSTAQGGCLPLIGRAARAGIDLAAMGVAQDCAAGTLAVPGSAAQVALLSLLTAVPVLIAHLLGAAVGTGVIHLLAQKAERVAIALAAALPRLPATATHVSRRRLRMVVERAPTPLPHDLSPRWLPRRGPPVACAA